MARAADIFRRLLIALALLALLVVVVLVYSARRLSREQPRAAVRRPIRNTFSTARSARKRTAFRIWVWLVLPRVFPEYLPGPGGYAALGLDTREGRDMPIGLSRVVTGGVSRVGINCAFCHTARVRLRAGRPLDDRSGSARPSGQLGSLPPLPDRLRVRSALHVRHAARRNRQELPAADVRTDALQVRDHSARAAYAAGTGHDEVCRSSMKSARAAARLSAWACCRPWADRPIRCVPRRTSCRSGTSDTIATPSTGTASTRSCPR